MRIADFIICDDIRTEIGNKHTLVGTYDHQIKILSPKPEEFKWPFVMKLAFFIRFKLDDNDVMPDRISFNCMQGDVKVLDVNGELAAVFQEQKKVYMNIVINANTVTISDRGHLSFNIKLYKGGEVIFNKSPDYSIEIMLEKTP